MKINFKKTIFFIFSTIFLTNCDFRNYDNVKDYPKPINYSVEQKSDYFNQKNIAFSLDSLNKTVYIKLTIKGLKHFPFPVSKECGDTLFNTAFNFDFYYHNKIIDSEYPALKNSFRYFNKEVTSEKKLSLSTDTVDLRKSKELQFQVPLYAFHNLKRGKQTIELSMSQTVFTGVACIINPDSSSSYIHVYETKPLLNARVKFDIDVPPVHKSIIYGLGLELKNDTTFSPAGMDNTIWKSSYPDIYWAIVYPQEVFYARTPIEPSTDKYIARDTFNLYHYHINDSIGFGVYDHDNLSRDDWMGDWWGSLNNLKITEYKRLKFGNVHHFDLQVKDGGMVN